MAKRSSEQVAKLVGISNACLSRYIKAGKVPAPPEFMAGAKRIRLWSDAEIECLRKVLPKIANGRKTRYQKLRERQKAPARVPVPHKQRKPRKKK